MSLGTAVEHAARQQREHAAHRLQVAADHGSAAGWRVAAVVEALALILLVIAALVLMHGRTSRHPSLPARRRASQPGT